MESTFSQYFPVSAPILATIPRGSFNINVSYPGFVKDDDFNTVFKEGGFYKITGIASTDDIDVILQCVETTQGGQWAKFSLRGPAKFINPDYQSIGDYSGVGDYKGTGYCGGFNLGVWSPDVEDAQGAGPDGCTLVFIWNGLHYAMSNSWSSSKNHTNPADNKDAYIPLPKSVAGLGYVTEWDEIEYDFISNWIGKWSDRRGNEIKNSFIEIDSDGSGNPLFSFQRGNDKLTNNKIYGIYIVDCLNNLGVIRSCKFYGGVTAFGGNFNLEVNCLLNDCEFGLAVDFSNKSALEYHGKVVYPHISTFNVELILPESGPIDVPPYAGIVRIINGNIGDNICNGFTSAIPFPVRFTVSAGSDTVIVFDNSVDFALPSPTNSVTLKTNDMDFITFLFNPITTSVDQIASEQY